MWAACWPVTDNIATELHRCNLFQSTPLLALEHFLICVQYDIYFVCWVTTTGKQFDMLRENYTEEMLSAYRPGLRSGTPVPVSLCSTCPWALLNHKVGEDLLAPPFTTPLKSEDELS